MNAFTTLYDEFIITGVGFLVTGGSAGAVIAALQSLLNDYLTDNNLHANMANKALNRMESRVGAIQKVWDEVDKEWGILKRQTDDLQADIDAYEARRQAAACLTPAAVDDLYIVDCNSDAPPMNPLESDENVPPGAVIEWLGQVGGPHPDPERDETTTIRIYRIRVPNAFGGEDWLSNKATVTIKEVCGDTPPPPGNPCANPGGYRQRLTESHRQQSGDDSYEITLQCGSRDPNDIVGPSGVGEEHWIGSNKTLDYMIRYENDPKEASAPAAVVRITETLDADLDFSSFRLGTMGFGDTIINEAVGLTSFQARLDFVAELGIYIDVSAGFDTVAGEAFWVLKSIDPATGEVPFDPFLGFLPPNKDGSEGQGYVSYSIKPKANAVTGDVVTAVANIVFDQNQTIATNQVDPHDPSQGTDPAKEALVTLDAGGPTSSVAAMSAQSFPGFIATWTGEDDAGGSGVGEYDVYVSKDGGPFTSWLTGTKLTEARFTEAEAGHAYAFYSMAVDRVGHREEAPETADAETTIHDPMRVEQVNLPSGPIRQVEVVFSKAMTLESMIADGSIAQAVAMVDQARQPVALAGETFAYDVASQTLTVSWQDALPAGLYAVELDGAELTGEGGEQLLGASSPSDTDCLPCRLSRPRGRTSKSTPIPYRH